jgi:uncharacterized Fe-S center protein
MSKLLFASAHVRRLSADDSLPAKFRRMLARCDLERRFKGKTVCIKMHFGGNIGYTTIHPLFVRILIRALKEAGAKPFCTDGTPALAGALDRGYTQEVLGCPVLPAGGVADKYFYETEINYESLKSVKLCGNVVDADALIVYSHAKGHGNCGYGGAIKNIAMGCVACESRGKIHALMSGHFQWDAENCIHCNQCVENCPTGAARFDDQGRFQVFDHHCRYCMHCVEACPNDCIVIDESRYAQFQTGMALTVKATLQHFEPEQVLFINHMLNITPLCDCWGFSSQSLVPDIGILAGDDIVAIEQATLDLIKVENYIPGTLPEQLVMGTEGHLFQRIHNKDPYIQVEACAQVGLGSREYELIEIE